MAKTPDEGRLELLQGTLDMLILRTLQWGPQHGHGIGQAIRTQSDDLLKVETGSLYPALHRLVKRGWLKAEWGVSQANQRAKFYKLTPEGKKQLVREESRWAQLVNAIGRVMKPAPAPGYDGTRGMTMGILSWLKWEGGRRRYAALGIRQRHATPSGPRGRRGG